MEFLRASTYKFEAFEGQVPYFKTHYIFSPNSNIQIEQTYQADDGFLWFGTNQGLYRYDGISTERIDGIEPFLR